MTDSADSPRLARTDDDEIEPPERFVAYEGAAVIKTPYSTRRPQATAEDPFPFPLGPTVCTASDILARRHTHLDVDQLEIVYTAAGDSVIYEVEEPAITPTSAAGAGAAAGGDD